MRQDIDLKEVTTPVLVHLLRDEFRFPMLFLLRCRLTLGGFKRNIDRRLPAELVELAALPLWVYISLKKNVGQRRAFEIMRVALLTGGIAQWNIAYRTVDRQRTFENLCDARRPSSILPLRPIVPTHAVRRRRSAFDTTVMLEADIASAPNSGRSIRPKDG